MVTQKHNVLAHHQFFTIIIIHQIYIIATFMFIDILKNSFVNKNYRLRKAQINTITTYEYDRGSSEKSNNIPQYKEVANDFYLKWAAFKQIYMNYIHCRLDNSKKIITPKNVI